ncbi:MAG: hypothetical protein ACR2P0_16925 [Acidimicrobiales bacterium]
MSTRVSGRPGALSIGPLVLAGVVGLAACTPVELSTDTATLDDAEPRSTTTSTIASSTTDTTPDEPIAGDRGPSSELRSDAATPVPTTDLNAAAPTTSIVVSPVTTDLLEEPRDATSYDAIFRSVVPVLQAETNIPIRLPLTTVFGDTDIGLQATIASVDADGYVIYVGFGECHGGTACRIATFTAQRIDEAGGQFIEPVVPIALPNGLPGELHDATCGANCGDATIEWTEGDVAYSVGEKAASGGAVHALAWVSITGDDPIPERPLACGPDAPADSGRVARVISTDVGHGHQLHWLVVCEEAGLGAELVSDAAEVRWVDLDQDGSKDIELTYATGLSELFVLSGPRPLPIVDFETFSRLRIVDLRCADVDDDGRVELVDAARNTSYDFFNPMSVVPEALDVSALSAEQFGSCE